MMRADVYLVSRGYAKSRESAKRSICASLVTCDGKVLKKAGELIDDAAEHVIDFRTEHAYVGRGGLKLEHALDVFAISVADLCAIDIGASTGGFTDCLLRRGAARVYAVDSGHGQLAAELVADTRVVSLEGINARYLTHGDIGEICDVIVMDVSFISQSIIFPRLSPLLTEQGVVISLIKPQFEVGRGGVGKGGVVKSAEYRKRAVKSVVAAAKENGFYLAGLVNSPILGGDGNREYLALWKRRGGDAAHEDAVSEQAVRHVDYS